MATICANCRAPLHQGDTTGESSLYSPHEAFTLCEPCWLAEDKLIEDEGTNNLPLLVEHYRENATIGVASRRKAS